MMSMGSPASVATGRFASGLDLAALAAYLRRCGLELDAEAGAERLGGGLSNLNYLVIVNGERAVLRRPPHGELPPGAHDMRNRQLHGSPPMLVIPNPLRDPSGPRG